MSDKKGKITLSGLTKQGSSNSFLSFRFSPESEEIEEVLQNDPKHLGTSESAPASPKPSNGGGDTSPLKEYFIKEKHKWANKWDKKSLSLDLDLKGKIITAIEDKKKSLMSNFIPEESAPIPQSQSNPEHIATAASSSSTSASTNMDDDDNRLKSCHGSDQSLDLSSSSKYEGTGHVDEFRSTDSPSGGGYSDVEEIGQDVTLDCDTKTVSYMDEEWDENVHGFVESMVDFLLSPHQLHEHYGGLPTLYQPVSLVAGIRAIPMEHPTPDAGDSSTPSGAVPLGSTTPSSSQESIYVGSKGDITIAGLFLDIIKGIVHHNFTKYWIGIVASLIILPLGGTVSFILTVILGAFTWAILEGGLSGPGEEREGSSRTQPQKNRFVPLPTEPVYRDVKLPSKSQGWMTQMDGDYNVSTCHMRQTKVVFVRCDNSRLFLSYPHPRHRIPKRRLWNDPVQTTDHVFVQHKVYSLMGAQVTIVPEGLAKKRIWNKKYPICITFAKSSVVAQITPDNSTEGIFSTSVETGTTATAMVTVPASSSVNYNVKEAGISVQKAPEAAQPPKMVIKKEIRREDSGAKSVYLFARCDREKDDWFRRLISAAKAGTLGDQIKRRTPDLLQEYRDYMLRCCPQLIPAFQKSPEGWDSPSTHAEPQPFSNKSDKGTPSSSKKSTPEKERSSIDDATPTDMDNVITVPQSPVFMNALIGRLFFDFLKSPTWKGEVQKLIDKKLFYMKKPAFIEDIHVKELELGNAVPIIHRTSAPIVDHQGLWIDFDITYVGTFCVTLETYVNLLKAKKMEGGEKDKDPVQNGLRSSIGSSHGTRTSSSSGGSRGSNGENSTSANKNSLTQALPKRSNVFDSDADDSGESSEDDDVDEEPPVYNPTGHDVDPNNAPKAGQRFLRYAEKFAASSLVNSGYIKKIVDNLGSTPLMLSVELKSCNGTLAVNIPPPPNDRIWLGFRTNPDIQLIARPKFGERTVNLSHITEWIKKKLLLEFQRVLVLPNMNDVTIPLMEFALPK